MILHWITQIYEVLYLFISHTDSSYCTGKMKHLYVATCSLVCRSKSHMYVNQKAQYWTHLNTCCQHSSEWLPISNPIDSKESILNTWAACKRIPGVLLDRPLSGILLDSACCCWCCCWKGSSLTHDALAICAKTVAQRDWSPEETMSAKLFCKLIIINHNIVLGRI